MYMFCIAIPSSFSLAIQSSERCRRMRRKKCILLLFLLFSFHSDCKSSKSWRNSRKKLEEKPSQRQGKCNLLLSRSIFGGFFSAGTKFCVFFSSVQFIQHCSIQGTTKGGDLYTEAKSFFLQNDGCFSTSTISSSTNANTRRNGTCFTTQGDFNAHTFLMPTYPFFSI